MMRDNYWEKVKDYAATFASFGNDWIRADIYDDMSRCRKDGEQYLADMDDKEFDEFAGDVSYWYFNTYFEK